MNKWVQFDLFVFAHAVLELMEALRRSGGPTPLVPLPAWRRSVVSPLATTKGAFGGSPG